MSANKDKKRGTWMVYIRYKDWQGLSQIHTKRGFSTKREALEYEREFLLKKSKDCIMLALVGIGMIICFMYLIMTTTSLPDL